MQLFSRKKNHDILTLKQQAENCFQKILNRSRDPKFYIDFEVDDTIFGRFEMMSLQMFIVIHTLKEKDESTEEYCNTLVKVFFKNLENNMREMGIGDMGLGKKIKRFSRIFYYRLHSYENALQSGELSLVDACQNSIFSDENKSAGKKMALYIIEEVEKLKNHPISQIMNGISIK